MPDSDDTLLNCGARLAKRLGRSTVAVAVCDPSKEGSRLGVVLARHSYVNLQYLAAGGGTRSAFKKFLALIKVGTLFVLPNKEIAEAFRVASEAAERKKELLRVEVPNPKAMIISWKEYSLLARFIEINSRASLYAEVAASATPTRSNVVERTDMIELLEA